MAKLQKLEQEQQHDAEGQEERLATYIVLCAIQRGLILSLAAHRGDVEAWRKDTRTFYLTVGVSKDLAYALASQCLREVGARFSGTTASDMCREDAKPRAAREERELAGIGGDAIAGTETAAGAIGPISSISPTNPTEVVGSEARIGKSPGGETKAESPPEDPEDENDLFEKVAPQELGVCLRVQPDGKGGAGAPRRNLRYCVVCELLEGGDAS